MNEHIGNNDSHNGDDMSPEQLKSLESEIELAVNGFFLTPSPTLFIGTGGMGKLIVNMLKSKTYTCFGLNPSNPNHDLPFLKFMAVDSALVDIEASSWYLTEKEYIRISWHNKMQLDELLQDPALHRALNMPRDMVHDERVDRVMSELLDALDGCSQVRIVGRMCLFMGDALKRISGTIRNALDELYRTYAADDLPDYKLVWDPANEKKHFQWRERSKSGLKFVIVSSLGGGTGTGIFLEIALIIRAILNEPQIKDQLKYGRNAKTIGCLLLPYCMESESNRDKLRANSYAALKELDHFLSGQPIDVDYSHFDAQLGRVILDNRTAENRLFQGVHLFEGENAGGAEIKHDKTVPGDTDRRYRIGDEISEFLMHNFIFDSCKDYWNLLPNKTAGDDTFSASVSPDKPDKYREMDAVGDSSVSLGAVRFKTAYSAFGISTLIYPCSTLMKQMKNRWMEKIVDHLLQDIKLRENGFRDISVLLCDEENPELALPKDLQQIIRHFQFPSFPVGSISTLENEIRKRTDTVLGKVRGIIPQLYDALCAAYDLTLGTDRCLYFPKDKQLSSDKEGEFALLIRRLKEIRETLEKGRMQFETNADYERWRIFNQNLKQRYEKIDSDEKKGYKKRWYDFFSPPRIEMIDNPLNKSEGNIGSGDIAYINDYFKHSVSGECCRYLGDEIRKIVDSLNAMLDRAGNMGEIRNEILDKLRLRLKFAADTIRQEYDLYEDLTIKNLISRRRFNLTASSKELKRLSHLFKEELQTRFDHSIELRQRVTPKIREFILRRGGIEKCTEGELYHEIESRLEEYLHAYRFKQFFYSQSLSDPNSFWNLASQNLVQFKSDLNHYAEPYIRLTDRPLWEPAPYMVDGASGGHRNKITLIRIIGGYSAHNIEHLSDWREYYSRMVRNHILHIFSDAETTFQELALVDRNVKHMNPVRFVDLCLKSGYLMQIEGNILIRSLPNKTKRFVHSIIAIKTGGRDLGLMLIHDPAGKLLFLNQYLEFMWSSRIDDFEWLTEIPWIKSFYGEDKFHKKFVNIDRKIQDMGIVLENDLPSFETLVSIFKKHDFLSDTDGELKFYSSRYFVGKYVRCEIEADRELLIKELGVNKWFLEEVMLGLCDYLQPECTNVGPYLNDIQGYWEAEQQTLPQLFKQVLERKLRQ